MSALARRADGVVVRRALRISGVVQGVGMRPFLHRAAGEHGLSGHVGNDTRGVFCEVEGRSDAVEAFVDTLRTHPPPLAVVESIEVVDVPPVGGVGFAIVSSTDAGDRGPVAVVPPDVATCDDCLREMNDPADRRYRYPFGACTFCGPRFTIVRGVPYDRPFTTMAAFPLCPACQREYDDPADRRFHAQPTACPRCGPRLAFRPSGSADATEHADAALGAAMRTLRAGGIVAVKGVGGYHLACDAWDEQAVARLRARKQRPVKPFALLARDLVSARGVVLTDELAERTLSSAQAPIALLPVRRDVPEVRLLRDSVAPRQSSLGVMLPPSGLHHLLMSRHPELPGIGPGLLVLTSANLADEPICADPDEADERLAGIADAWLHHDRPIHLACDDSVVRMAGGNQESILLPVRRSRGYAPVPVQVPLDCPATLAVGGELKATVCLAEGRRAWVSQHLGDVASLEAVTLLERTVDVLQVQSRVTPQHVVADLHPGYLSRRWARDLAGRLGVDLVGVQHHHAHLGSLLAEHGVAADEPVLGVIFDGSGYGLDGGIWGGEFLMGSYATVTRVAHLGAVPLPGGDAAVTHPARVAMAHLDAAGLAWDEGLPPVSGLTAQECALLGDMLRSGSGCVPTTSMGRLFDAVSALVGQCQRADYEGQAAMELEALLDGRADVPPGEYRFGVVESAGGWLVDARPVIASVVRDVLDGRPSAVVSARFHAGTSAMVAEVARLVRDRDGIDTVGLSGGVFQNAVMTTQCRRRLAADGFRVFVHQRVPPNDGGLALGQAVVAAGGGGR